MDALQTDTAELVVEWVAVDAVFPNPANPRVNDAAVEPVADSLRRFGWQQPIVAKESGEVVAGHTRLRAAKQLGMERVPVLRFHGSDIDAVAYGIADNRTATFAEWDEPALAALLAQLQAEDSLDGVGFTTEEIGLLLRAQEPEVEEDEGPGEVPENPVTERGDLWILGDHRLLCGDSTSAEDMARLMGDDKAALLASDPPYLVDYDNDDGAEDHWDAYTGDEAGIEFFLHFLRIALPHCRADLAGKVEASGTVALTGDESTSLQTAHIDETESDPLLAIDIGSVGQMSTSIYGDSGQDLEESRSYFLVPASGAGSDGTNYDATFYGYDDEGRQRRVEEASGTLRRTTYDAMGRVASRLIGTNDYGYAGGDASGTADMVTTELLEYDGNADDGNGYLTKRTMRVEDDSTNERVTTYEHDARGNVLLATNPTAPHVFVKVDNLGRTIARGSFSATTNIVVGTDDPTTETSNRLALNQSFYDEMGRVYKTQRHQIDTADGSDDDNLVALTWYDERGRVIMVDGEELSKTFYDRVGRVTHRFTLAKVDADEWNSGSYGEYDDALNLGGDTEGDWVLVERQTTYESTDSDDVIMEAVISRHHDDLDGSGTEGALDSNADSDGLKYTAANVEGRIQIRAMWYDGEGRGRVTTEVNYGTYGGASFDRDGLTEPTRSADALRTDYVYNTDGTLKSVTDPRDLETRYTYDDAGRQTVVIRNYVNGTPSGTTGDDDVHTRTEYTDGLRTKLWVDFDGDDVEDAGDQVTTYTYGTTKGTSAGDSEIGTGHLLQKIAYPDSTSGTDVVTFAYNAQGQQTYKKDQATNVIETVFDDSGRELHRRVTSINTGAGFDNAVLRISTTYDSLGRRQLITQYDNATVGSGSVTDEVKYTYEGWGYISKIEQDNNSVVSGGGDEYEISYTYEDQQVAGRNTIRRVNFVAPSGNTFDHEYRSVGNRFDDDCSRVTHIDDGTTLLALYAYNGVGQVVGIDYSGVDVKMERFGGGGYDRLDRFDRVTSDIWTAYSATATNVYELDIVYDENGNITRTDDHVHPTKFDVVYTIDGLDRLSNAQEGDLNGTSTIQTEAREQDWTLDQVGNWDHAKLDLNGDDDYVDTDEYDDDRDHNAVNEITTRDVDNDSSTDYTLTYDAAGNLTDDAEEYEYVYDAFYRLRKVNDQSQDLVAEHRYNGLGHRIAEHADTDDDGDVDANDEWHHFCYDARWRVVAMFVDSDTAPTEEFMHHGAGNSGFGGSSYIDEVARRDRDTDDNGSMEEQVFYCQNWRHDVVCIVDGSGGQLEMVRYSAYGVPFGLPGGDADSDGDCDDGDTVDTDQIQTWITSGPYDVRGDLDLDGGIDAGDKAAASAAPFQGAALGSGAGSIVSNDRAYAGYPRVTASYQCRHRWLLPKLGVWSSRDPIDYIDVGPLYEYAASNPIAALDPSGLWPCEGVECWSYVGTDNFDFTIKSFKKKKNTRGCKRSECERQFIGYMVDRLRAGWAEYGDANDCASPCHCDGEEQTEHREEEGETLFGCRCWRHNHGGTGWTRLGIFRVKYEVEYDLTFIEGICKVYGQVGGQ